MDLAKFATRLNLVGSFSDVETAKMVKRAPGWEHVNELGVLDRGEVRDVLQRSFAGLVTFHPLPNHVDAQPNKMFEYMSAGVPVIASDFPLWNEIIIGNDCGLCVNPMSPDAIARAIDQLAGDPELARKMGANGRRAVVEKYNWSVEEARL
jgi:glycosyltransferase involved in cell wall biosynthesis